MTYHQTSLAIFQKTQYLVNGESDKKKKSVPSKQDANLNFRPNPTQQTYLTCRINVWQTTENFGSSLLLIDTNWSIH